jgi:hypothetical protein
MSAYPSVLSEGDTLQAVHAGKSLARYGDGEFALCRGRGIKCQRFDPALSRRLQGILQTSGHCLVGIPNIRSATPKASFWRKYLPAAELLGAGPYGSAFVTRPDSAPWIDTPAYWASLEALWRDQEVALLRGSERSLTAADLTGARQVHEIVGPDRDAWSKAQRLLERVLYTGAKRVLLCLGPTATVLAVDLCAVGAHAIDLGHVGMFLRKHRRGEPMVVTQADKEAAA